jgi:Leucine-rich repeat (LRR) protein
MVRLIFSRGISALTLILIVNCLNPHLSGQVLEQDSLALVCLYDSTNGSTWWKNDNWLEGPVSTWYGVEVTGNRVTKINLYYNNLRGIIPHAIGNLTGLKAIFLNDNHWGGELPPEIGMLVNLENLDISFHKIDLPKNTLTGQIPPEIGNMASLRYLDLSYNRLQGAIPAEIGNLVNLEYLELSDNKLSGPIPAEIGKLANLVRLNLHGNERLKGRIPPEIGNLKNLRTLNLSGNLLTGPIPIELTTMDNLGSLILYINQLSGPIPPEIGNMANLQVLMLYNNQLSGPIPPEVGQLTGLKTLYLSYNQLEGPIPPEIGNLSRLTFLSLYHNNISGEIPTEIGNLTNLTRLYLTTNELSGSIPSSICQLAKLISLGLADNGFTGAVPEAITALTNLEIFDLDHNQLDDLPDISSISSLAILNINDNRFTFEDIEPHVGVQNFRYVPQEQVGEPIDTTVHASSDFTLAVTVEGSANQYEWRKNTVPIPGATSASYTINSIKPEDGGTYVCRITNSIADKLTLKSKQLILRVIPGEYAIHPNFPNPFNISTTIPFDLPEAIAANILIYDLTGKEIAHLTSEVFDAGYHSVYWDGRRTNGETLPSGIYIARLVTPGYSKAIKMVLLK